MHYKKIFNFQLFLIKVIQNKNHQVKMTMDNNKRNLNKTSSHQNKRRKKNKAVNNITMKIIMMKIENIQKSLAVVMKE